MIRIFLALLAVSCLPPARAAVNFCENVLFDCQKDYATWTSCYEEKMMTCTRRGRTPLPGFHRVNVNSSSEAEVNVTDKLRLQVPSSALQKSKGAAAEEEVLLVTSVLNSTWFQSRPEESGTTVSRVRSEARSTKVLDWTVLSVRSGTSPVANLTEPIRMTFKNEEKAKKVSCVFWKVPDTLTGTAGWSTEGCETHHRGEEITCSSSHMSFFAVLVMAEEVKTHHSRNLSYISYVGSALSVAFAFIAIFIFVSLNRRRPEKAIGIHLQLTVALLCLHLTFLLSCFWFRMQESQEDSWVCSGLGLILHWSLLATMTWLALEGFHLYLLLIKVFNIYVRRYLLKLSVVGWGFPTVVALSCVIAGVYGKYNVEVKDDDSNASSPICWMRSDFGHRQVVGYVTVAFLFLVVVYNTCVLALVVFRMYLHNGAALGRGRSSGEWKKIRNEKGNHMGRKCVAVLILSCVLGLPWGLTSAAYVSTAGIYVFTVLNSLQGFFMFLWSVSLSCKSRAQKKSTVSDLSSQKMISTNSTH